MAKHKIPKNRSIEDMFQGVEEEATFETTGWEDDEVSAVSYTHLTLPTILLV